MTARFPLIVDAATKTISELPPTDDLDFTNNGIVNLDVARLSVTGGNNNEVLSTNGAGTLSWKPFVSPSVFRAVRLVDQAIPANTMTTVIYNSLQFDTTGGAYNTVTGRFQPTVAGYYQLNGAVTVGPGGITTYVLDIFLNGNTYIRGVQINSATGVCGGSVVGVVPFNGTTDFAEVKLLANRTGGPIIYGIFNGAPITTFSGHFVAPL